MWTILDAAEFLDLPLAFTYRKNDGNFDLNAISVYKVYIDFWIKLVGTLFVNDKQMLTESFKSFLTLCSWRLEVCLSMYDLFLAPGLKALRHFPACYKFLDNLIEI